MIKLKDLIFELLENVPQKGISSGDAIKWKSAANVLKIDMTLDEILNNIEGVPYYKAVVVDYDKEDDSWDVTKKVVEYAEHFKKHPESIANLPPIIVVDGELQDGAHRISAIYLLRERMDKQNPLWNKLKLKVEFGKNTDVLFNYNISYEEFDELKNSIWRKLANKKQEKKAITYMLKYLNYNRLKLEDRQIGLILWHVGQLYAMIDDYKNAIKYMSMNEIKSSIEPNYQNGTIAFLKKDFDQLKMYYNKLLDYDPTGGSGKDILKKFIDHFNKPYYEVY
jgi:tetratricopeptide (TPR) repeat protein